MTIQYNKFFAPTVLTTSAATLYTVPALPSTNLLRGGRIRFTNTTTSSTSVTAYAVPSGGVASSANAFLLGKTIGPNDYLDIDVPVLSAGDFIQVLSPIGASVTAHAISGAVFS